MAEKIDKSSASRKRGDTLIGTGLRVDGKIEFTGALHVQGDILGDVSCPDDPQGTLIVADSGSVTGTIRVPRIVVKGRICGPLYSSQSIQVQAGAQSDGDTTYKELAVHAGGIIKGFLTPLMNEASERTAQEPSGVAVPAAKETGVPPAAVGSADEPSPVRRKLAWAAALAVVVLAAAWLRREPATQPPVPVSIAESPAAAAAPKDVLPASAGGGTPGIANAVAGNAVFASAATAAPQNPVQNPAPDRPEADSNKVIAVPGLTADKSPDIFFLITNEPSVLVKKKRGDPSDGTRIEVPQGKNMRIPIGRNELLKVAKGHDLEIFYQGRKVAASTIESGAWMSFVPQSPSDERTTQ